MIITGIIGNQRFPKNNQKSKDGFYIFGFSSSDMPRVTSINITKPKMLLINRFNEVTVDYSDTESSDFGISLKNCEFIYNKKLYNDYDKENMIKKLSLPSTIKDILLSRKDPINDILNINKRLDNDISTNDQSNQSSEEEPLENILDPEVIDYLSAIFIDNESRAVQEKLKIKEIIKDAIKNLKPEKQNEILTFLYESKKATEENNNLMKSNNNTNKTYDADAYPQCIYQLPNASFTTWRSDTIDNIGKALGIENNNPYRIEFFINKSIKNLTQSNPNSYENIITVQRAALNGITNRDEVKSNPSLKNTLITKDDITKSLNQMVENQRLMIEGNDVYLKEIYNYEMNIASNLLKLERKPPIESINEDELNIDNQLDDYQKNAVITALKKNVSVITGGPGTGKTTIIKNIINNDDNWTPVLLAPTGRASSRIAESTGHKAFTFDKFIRLNPNSDQYAEIFYRNKHKNLHIICDEMSMATLSHLSRIISFANEQHINNLKFTFIGDPNQLDSIGVGNVLSDLINSFPTSKLVNTYRQASSEESIVSQTAKNIINGKPLYIPNVNQFDGSQDMLKFPVGNDKLEQTIEALINKTLPSIFDGELDLINDVQILTPFASDKHFMSSTNLSNLLNGGSDFKLGSKVIHTVNNYIKGVMNGQIGEIVEYNDDVIEEGSPRLKVKFKEFKEPIEYFDDDLDELTLANAITIHKAQGSEFKAVIIPILQDQAFMMNKKLIYTAITRAKELCILVGETNQFDLFAKKNAPKRNSKLADRINNMRTQLESQNKIEKDLNQNLNIESDVKSDLEL